jgi:hypothetical protein
MKWPGLFREDEDDDEDEHQEFNAEDDTSSHDEIVDTGDFEDISDSQAPGEAEQAIEDELRKHMDKHNLHVEADEAGAIAALASLKLSDSPVSVWNGDRGPNSDKELKTCPGPAGKRHQFYNLDIECFEACWEGYTCTAMYSQIRLAIRRELILQFQGGHGPGLEFDTLITHWQASGHHHDGGLTVTPGVTICTLK